MRITAQWNPTQIIRKLILMMVMKKLILLTVINIIFFCVFFVSCSKNNDKREQLTLYQKYKNEKVTQPNSILLDRIENIEADSLKQRLIYEYSDHFLVKNDSSNFLFWNLKAAKLASKRKDSISLAETLWDKATFYYKLNQNDSAFYYYKKTSKIYLARNELKKAADLILSMAIVQKRFRDYQGSEVTTIQAMRLYRKVNSQRGLYDCYNCLGILHNNLKLYKLSSTYHSKALAMAKQLNSQGKIATSYNNIGVSYGYRKKYDSAKYYFNKAELVKGIDTINSRLYAMVIDSKAHAQMYFQNDSISKDSILKAFNRSRDIRIKLKHAAGISINNIHRAEFYLLQQDTLTAKRLLVDALSYAEDHHLMQDKLDCLKMLSKIDAHKGLQYLQSFVSITDSLTQLERRVSNKFARIQYQTDVFKEKSNQLSKEKQVIIIGAVVLILVIILLSFIIYLKNRNKKLVLQRQQELANQEIYRLLFQQQQQKLEQGREQEKKRISKELHDGILGQLYGIRFLLLASNANSDMESVKKRAHYLTELEEVEKQIRSLSHELRLAIKKIDDSFLVLIEKYIEDRNLIGKTNFQLQIDKSINFDRILTIVKINLYRILQEALTNVMKYAEARFCMIKFKEEPNSLKVTIEDNGIGFEIDTKKSGIGINNMKDRTADIEGKFKISSDNSGTLIVILLPKSNIYGKVRGTNSR